MKLRNLAALLIRMFGALLVLSGLDATLNEVLDTGKIGALAAAISGLLVGGLMICFSKKLAALFCKGLDDDQA